MRRLFSASMVAVTMLLATFFVAFTATAAVDFVDYQGQLTDVPREILAKNSARIMVNGGEFIAYTSDDGSFVLHNLPAGSHLVEVVLSGYRFPGFRIDVSAKKGRVQTVVNDGTAKSLGVFYFDTQADSPNGSLSEEETNKKLLRKRNKQRAEEDENDQDDQDESENIAVQRNRRNKMRGSYGDIIRIPAIGKHLYFEEHVPFNPMAYLKNPMVIMLALTGLLSWMSSKMPKDEMKAAMRDMQSIGKPGQAQVQGQARGGAQPRVNARK